MPEGNQIRRKNAVRFSRVLRLSWATAIGASASVGLGVYVLLPHVAQITPPDSAWQPYLLMAVLALPILLTYAERAAVIPGSGGAYDLARPGEFLWLAYSTGWVIIGGYICLVAVLGWGVAYHLDIFLKYFFNLHMDVRWLAASVIALVFLNSLLGMAIFWRTRATAIYLSIAFLFAIFVWAYFLPVEIGAAPAAPVTAPGAPATTFYAAVLLMSSLWGLNFILSLRDELQRPTRTILPAMLLSVTLGAGSGILGALDAARGLQAAGSTALWSLDLPAGALMDGVKTALYIAFGLSINLLALNQALDSAQRVLNAMSRDGFLPVTGGRKQALPLLLLSLASGLLIHFAPMLTVVGLASLGFLWSATLVHAPDLLRASPNLPKNRTPRLPFHPLFPGLTVVVGLLAPLYLRSETWWWALAWILLGALYYLAYARRSGQSVHWQAVIVGETESQARQQAHRYRVMVGIANPETAIGLIQAGAKFARARQASLRVLRVLRLPDQMPAHLKHQAAQDEWRVLTELIRQAEVAGVTVTPLVRLASHPAEGILAAVGEEWIDLLLVGWGGRLPGDDLRSDPVLSVLIRHAPCEVAILHGQLPATVQRAAVPSAGGPYAPAALRLGEDLIKEQAGEVALVHIVTGGPGAARQEQAIIDLRAMQSLAEEPERVKPQVVESDSIQSGILEAADRADLMLIGASKGGLPERPYFGGLAVEVARASQRPILLVRGREKWRYPRLRYFIETLFDPFPTLTAQRRSTVVQNMRQASAPSFDYFILIVLSSVIASMGLLQNSAAVIIGAMLVAPLMSPILAVAMSMVLPDLRALWTAAEATIKGVTLAVVVSIVMVLVSPLREPTAQILARTEPNLLDLIVALASGAAAGYAVARKEVAAALPGVAIAAALVPPLCVVGYGIGTSQLQIASGALLLFITNLVAIVFAAALAFLGMGFSSTRAQRGELLRGLQATTFLLLLVLAVLGYTTVVTVRQLKREQHVKALFDESLASQAAQVKSLEIIPQGGGFTLEAEVINFESTPFTLDDLHKLEQEMSAAVDGPVRIHLTLLPATQMDLKQDELRRQSLLAQVFRDQVEARSAQVVDLQVSAEDGFALQATLILTEGNQFDEQALQAIGDQVSRAAGAPVSMRITILSGKQVELEAGQHILGK